MAVRDRLADASWFSQRRCGEIDSDIQPIGIVTQLIDAYVGHPSIFV